MPANRPETTLWLISYRYAEACRTETGVSFNEPLDTVGLLKSHPAAFIAAKLEDLEALGDAPYQPQLGPQQAVRIERVYSAIPVPDGTLTIKQAMALSEGTHE